MSPSVSQDSCSMAGHTGVRKMGGDGLMSLERMQGALNARPRSLDLFLGASEASQKAIK